MTAFFERRRKLVAQFDKLQVDALFVTAGPNVRYLSGFSGSNGALLITPRQSVLLTDPRYTIRASTESDCKVKIAKASQEPNWRSASAFAASDLSRLGSPTALTRTWRVSSARQCVFNPLDRWRTRCGW
jgi:Xaa-Pro aminopeptidase